MFFLYFICIQITTYCYIIISKLGDSMQSLPSNAYVLLSVVNTKLRDFYSSLDALCDDLGEDKEEIINILSTINYHYDEDLNQFKN